MVIAPKLSEDWGTVVGLGGFTLADLYRAEAAAGKGSSNKSVINVFLGGDLLIRTCGKSRPKLHPRFGVSSGPIPTNVPGIQICEMFPRLAQCMDRSVVIRSVVGCKIGMKHINA